MASERRSPVGCSGMTIGGKFVVVEHSSSVWKGTLMEIAGESRSLDCPILSQCDNH